MIEDEFEFDAVLKTMPKRAALVPVITDSTARTGCFQNVTPVKRIGNLTINTVKRIDQTRTPLKPISQGDGLPRSVHQNSVKRLQSGRIEDKENVAPGRVNSKLDQQFDQPSLIDQQVTNFVEFDEDPLSVDPSAPWDALDKIIRLSIPDGIDSPMPIKRNQLKPQPRQLQDNFQLHSEASQLEELLYSNDVLLSADDPDVFLGFDQESNWKANSIHNYGPQIARPRSSSMVSVASRASSRRSLPASKIEVKVRASKRELPSLKVGSQLRKMIIPGVAPRRTGNTCDNGLGEGADYATFLNKYHADGSHPIIISISLLICRIGRKRALR